MSKPTDELDRILDGLCAAFARDMAAQSSIRLRDMDKVKRYYSYKEAKAAIQALVNKARIDELQDMHDGFKSAWETKDADTKYVFQPIIDVLAARLSKLKATQGQDHE